MKRKVVLHGTSTLIVSLPSKWVKKHGIKKGDELEVKENGNNLIIFPSDNESNSSITLNLCSLDRTSIMFTIRSVYRKGYDNVTLTWKNPLTKHIRLGQNVKVISVIHEEVNRLVGYEIVQEKGNICVIKDLQKVDFKEFDNILRKIFLLIQNAFETLINGIKNNDLILLDTIEEIHNTITKFVSYCLRIINKKGCPNPKNSLSMYRIISILDRLIDSIKNCSRTVILNNIKFSNEGIKLMKMFQESFKHYHTLFYHYSIEPITKMSELREIVAQRLNQQKNMLNDDEVMIINYMYGVMEMLLDLTEARVSIEY